MDLLKPELSIVLRSLTVYVFIVIGIRLFGKKELSQLSVVDLVFILLISNSVQNAMVGPDVSLLGGLLAASALFGVNYIFKFLLFRSKKFSAMVQGNPVLLVYEGEVITKHMESEKITMDELKEAMREHGVSKIENIDLAVLEVDGNISVISDDYQKKSRKKKDTTKA